MACLFCEGLLGHCDVCGAGTKPNHPSWEQRLESRRHQGSHLTIYQANSDPVPVRQGLHSFVGSGYRGRARYSRAFNDQYSGPGKGTW